MGRGFEVVKDEARKTFSYEPTRKMDNKIKTEKEVFYVPEIQLPTRSDSRSAGYDFYAPQDVTINPAQKVLIFTDVKAYMEDDEVLKLFIRSSLAVKQGLMLTNNVGIVDASYYSNEGNDGNIGIPMVNTSGKAIEIKTGERIAQGIFEKYLTIDGEEETDAVRTGGIGSSGK